MRDLEARQVRRYAPVASAVVVTPNDAEVRGDVQLFLRVVADDIVDRQVAVVGRRRECRGAAFDLEVREQTRARGRTAFAHVEDVTRRGGRRCVVAGGKEKRTIHVFGIRIDRAWESRGRSRIIDPVPYDRGRVGRIRIVRYEDAARGGCCPQRSMVSLVTSDPRDRPSRPVIAIGTAGQIAPHWLEIAATRVAERGEFRTVRLIIGYVRRCVLRNTAGMRTCSKCPRAPHMLEP